MWDDVVRAHTQRDRETNLPKNIIPKYFPQTTKEEANKKKENINIKKIIPLDKFTQNV